MSRKNESKGNAGATDTATEGGSKGVVGKLVEKAKDGVQHARDGVAERVHGVQERVQGVQERVAEAGAGVADRVRKAAKSAGDTVRRVTGRAKKGEQTIQELRKLAAEKKIVGRSRMSRAELHEALGSAPVVVETAEKGSPDLTPPADADHGSSGASLHTSPEVEARRPNNPPTMMKPATQKSGRTR
jgi:hypothetical protein